MKPALKSWVFSYRAAAVFIALALVCASFLALRSCSVSEPPVGGNEGPSRTSPLKRGETPAPTIEEWSRRFSIQRPPKADLMFDSEVVSGELSNGLRYLVKKEPAEAGEVCLRFLVMVGAMHEEPGEEGFSHFIEHLAFQDPDGTAGGSVIEAFELLGLAPGADANAATYPDRTIYRLDLPTGDAESLEAGLGFFARLAGNMSFHRTTVDEERRVVLREFAEHSSRTNSYQKAFFLSPWGRPARHRPAGIPESVEAATAEELRNFWRTHYVPRRMVFVAVGDLNADAMVERIGKRFGNLADKAAPPEPDPGERDVSAPDLLVITDETVKSVDLSLAATLPPDREPDSPAKRRSELVRQVALEMDRNRLARMFKAGRVPGSAPSAGAADLVPGARWVELTTSVDPRDLTRVLGDMIRNWRGTSAHPFGHSEFAEAKGEVRNKLRRQFLERQEAGARSTADLLVDSFVSGRTVESPVDELNRSLTDLATLTMQECESQGRLDWKQAPRLVVRGPVDRDLEPSLRNVLEVSMNAAIPAPATRSEFEPLVLPSVGTAGRVERMDLDAGRGFLEAELSNRVLVRLAPIPSLGGYVRVRVDVGFGRESLQPGREAVVTAARLLCYWRPIEGWTNLRLDAALAEEDVSWQQHLPPDSIRWVGDTDRSQLRRQLDLLLHIIHRPGFEWFPETWRPDRHDLANERAAAVRRSEMMQVVDGVRAGDDPRFVPFPEGLSEVNRGQVSEWLKPALTGGRLCVSIAGDFDPTVALADVAATFGALPVRASWRSNSPYPPPPPTEPGIRMFPRGRSKFAAVGMMLPLGPSGNPQETLRRMILQRIVGIRLRDVFREKLGESYGPRVMRTQLLPRSTDWLELYVPCAPGRGAEVSDLLRAMIEDIGANGWERVEYRRAVRPLPHVLKKRLRSPDKALDDMGAAGAVPDGSLVDDRLLDAMETEVRKLARRVLDPDAAVELRFDDE